MMTPLSASLLHTDGQYLFKIAPLAQKTNEIFFLFIDADSPMWLMEALTFGDAHSVTCHPMLKLMKPEKTRIANVSY